VADAARAELAEAAKAAAALLKRAGALTPSLTDQAGENVGACSRARQMEEGLAEAASQAAQQQRRVEQLERGALASPGLPELSKGPLTAGLSASRSRADAAASGLRSARSGLQRSVDQAARLAAEVRRSLSPKY
jgi:hypothetical protein